MAKLLVLAQMTLLVGKMMTTINIQVTLLHNLNLLFCYSHTSIESLIFVHVHRYVNSRMIWSFAVLLPLPFLGVGAFYLLDMTIIIVWDGTYWVPQKNSIINSKDMKIESLALE